MSTLVAIAQIASAAFLLAGLALIGYVCMRTEVPR